MTLQLKIMLVDLLIEEHMFRGSYLLHAVPSEKLEFLATFLLTRKRSFEKFFVTAGKIGTWFVGASSIVLKAFLLSLF